MRLGDGRDASASPTSDLTSLRISVSPVPQLDQDALARVMGDTKASPQALKKHIGGSPKLHEGSGVPKTAGVKQLPRAEDLSREKLGSFSREDLDERKRKERELAGSMSDCDAKKAKSKVSKVTAHDLSCV